MKLPLEAPVLTLPNATLFPQSLLPLYIFEPRYRRMLADALHSNRMLAVAMRKPGSARETPLPMAGLGLIRASVAHRDGTSHVVLQGLARVELERAVRYQPYRVNRIKTVRTPPCDTVAADALLAKVRELLEERMQLNLPLPFPAASQSSCREILNYLDSISDPEQAADQISYAVLPEPAARQTILETIDVETRLRRLIQFLLAELRQKSKGDTHD